MSHLRVAPASTDAPIPVSEAIERAQSQHKVARDAYIDLLAIFGEYPLRQLLRSDGKVTVPRLRSMRDAAQRMTERAQVIVAALDACIDTCERAKP